ncbi:10889_t:CDS:2 [Ambispora leptoticha]|uniref:10889_t:CDS:1 n=1 Tax=Ambispora leptoticha TaxID=144679 RepID=A0A9N8WBL8_9GLOM|nr:10889_t:CDS:2 [Ambispora leptoticha]
MVLMIFFRIISPEENKIEVTYQYMEEIKAVTKASTTDNYTSLERNIIGGIKEVTSELFQPPRPPHQIYSSDAFISPLRSWRAIMNNHMFKNSQIRDFDNNNDVNEDTYLKNVHLSQEKNRNEKYSKASYTKMFLRIRLLDLKKRDSSKVNNDEQSSEKTNKQNYVVTHRGEVETKLANISKGLALGVPRMGYTQSTTVFGRGFLEVVGQALYTNSVLLRDFLGSTSGLYISADHVIIDLIRYSCEKWPVS